MIFDAQHLIDAHQSVGSIFNQATSNEIWYEFERDLDNVHCAHGVIKEGDRFVFESDHVISDESGEPDLAEALRVYFEQIGDEAQDSGR